MHGFSPRPHLLPEKRCDRVVERSEGVVEHVYVRVRVDGAREGDARLLPAAEPPAALPHGRPVALGPARNVPL